MFRTLAVLLALSAAVPAHAACQDIWYDGDRDGYGGGAPTYTCNTIPTGWTTTGGDCDDADAGISPSAIETCDGVDEDCDGLFDDPYAYSTFYADADGDAWGSGTGVPSCAAPAGYPSIYPGDCDDTNAAVNPFAPETCNGIDDNCDGAADNAVGPTWYYDGDNDNYGTWAGTSQACTKPANYAATPDDCNDGLASVHPGATEVCNNYDDDCDYQTDEGVQTTWYADSDADGYGNLYYTSAACSRPNGFVSDSTDCDDGNGNRHPGAAEVCNYTDDDCDGSMDEGVTPSWYADVDADGYGAGSAAWTGCNGSAGFVSNDDDCNDGNFLQNPGVAEVCDGVDQDCDAAIDDGVKSTYFADADHDTYGDPDVTTEACAISAGWVDNHADCDDGDDGVHPGASESCNGDDDDCNGLVDDNVGADWFIDGDADGWGDELVLACSQPVGAVSTGGDCNDSVARVYPGAVEHCDGVDEDCDGTTDEGATDLASWYDDDDGDGLGAGSATVACSPPTGTVGNADDCDDTDPDVLGPQEWWVDLDRDGVGDGSRRSLSDCDPQVGRVNVEGDCDDLHDYVSPLLDELCNGFDDNCDAVVDTDAVDMSSYWPDADNDGWGESGDHVADCVRPSGTADRDGDCDDSTANINPGAVEQCDSLDNDCDGTVDDDAVDVEWFADADADGWGDADASAGFDCLAPEGTVSNALDCDDNAPDISPNALELCNGADDDCDGSVDDEPLDGAVFFVDADEDGVGAGSAILACEQPVGTAELDGDCDDDDDAVSPLLDEICGNTLDDDCDGFTDDVGRLWWVDADADGFGDDDSDPVDSCEPVDGYADEPGDCNDADGTVWPGADDPSGDGIDQACDGDDVDDLDGDGFSAPEDCDDSDPDVYPGAEDRSGDAIDQDCDGSDATSDGTERPREGSDDEIVTAQGCGCSGGGAPVGLLPALLTLFALRRRGARS